MEGNIIKPQSYCTIKLKEAFTCISNISKDCLPDHTDDRTACGLSTHLQSLSDDGFSSCCYGRLPALWQTDVTNHGFIFIQQKQKPSWVAKLGSDWSHVLQKAQFVPEEQRSEFLYFVLSLLRFLFLFFFLFGFSMVSQKKLVSEHKILKVCTLWSDYLGFFLFPFFLGFLWAHKERTF